VLLGSLPVLWTLAALLLLPVRDTAPAPESTDRRPAAWAWDVPAEPAGRRLTTERR
jgi:hypothetical protein